MADASATPQVCRAEVGQPLGELQGIAGLAARKSTRDAVNKTGLVFWGSMRLFQNTYTMGPQVGSIIPVTSRGPSYGRSSGLVGKQEMGGILRPNG